MIFQEGDDILIDINNNNKLQESKEEQNIIYDNEIIQLQENLLMMGFDINMINKIIMHFNIRRINEAIDYLSKTEDGIWQHPFVESKEEEKIDTNDNIEITNNLLDNVLSKVKMLGDEKSHKDICDICGERKEFHLNKDYENNNLEEPFIDYDLDNEYLLNNNLLDNNNIIENVNIYNNNECSICLDKLENPVEIEKCKHRFCRDCFSNYVNNLINTNNIENIPCPEVKCNNKSLSPDFFSHYITENQLIKYQIFKTKNEIAKDKLKIFCPLCNSYAKIDDPEKYNTNNPTYKKSKLSCQEGHEFCSCGRPNHEGECYHDGEEFKNLINKEKIKKCPKCGFLIKKKSGCNHMICGNKACKFEFCWLCLKESLPGHYESGPCLGKQFINPDSIFYQLENKYPILYYIFFFFKLIFIILCFCISLCFPALLLWPLTAFILHENFIIEPDDLDKLFILSKKLSITHYIICIPILLSVQTIYYMILAICLIFLVVFLITRIFIGIYFIIIFFIYKCQRR